MFQMIGKRHKVLIKALCLLFCTGIMLLGNAGNVFAAEREGSRVQDYDSLGIFNDRTNPPTVIREPGSNEAADDLKELNIGNNLSITYNDGQGNLSGTLRILIILTMLSLAPVLLILLTSFTRIIIVLHFTRAAVGTQTSPPNQVMLGLALFLTFFIMSPVLSEINEKAVKPFEAGEISQQEFFETALDPLREFMFGQTMEKDAIMFFEIAGLEANVEDIEEIPTSILVPSFVVSELRRAFTIGFIIYIPFIVIDMVVASTLMSMGMMMLPPTTISMPFKILLFVLADGWNLVIGNLVRTFYY